MAVPRIGLALGSGSARGWSHIGVVEALAEAGIVPDVVCGASIGALVGAACVTDRLAALKQWAEAATWREIVGLLDIRYTRGGLIDGALIMAFLRGLGVDGPIESFDRRFAAIATDLASGRELWLQEGPITDAVRASIALPGIVSPMPWRGSWLVDGGLVNPVPVSTCRALGADVVIAVDLNSDLLNRRFGSGADLIASETPPSSATLARLFAQLPEPVRQQAEQIAPAAQSRAACAELSRCARQCDLHHAGPDHPQPARRRAPARAAAAAPARRRADGVQPRRGSHRRRSRRRGAGASGDHALRPLTRRTVDAAACNPRPSLPAPGTWHPSFVQQTSIRVDEDQPIGVGFPEGSRPEQPDCELAHTNAAAHVHKLVSGRHARRGLAGASGREAPGGGRVMMQGVDFQEFHRALAGAFSKSDLVYLTRVYLNEPLENIVNGGSLRDIAFELLSWAERVGAEADLARAAYLERPRKAEIRLVYEKYGLAPAVAVHQNGNGHIAALAATGSAFEARIKPHLTAVDIETWREGLTRIEGRVCRVENGGNAMGTGFLVGPDLVLTNYHVLERFIERQLSPTRVACRFDYKVLADGSRSEGVVVNLHPDGWLVDASRYSRAEADNAPDRELPGPDELDYALVRLARAVGGEPLGRNAAGGALRGWIALPEQQPALQRGMPILIAQHPDGSPLKLALDTDGLISANGNGTRVRYATNTEHGSSGAPCFDMDWSVVALHHMGDPAWKTPQYNQGIPIGAIRQRLGTRIE